MKHTLGEERMRQIHGEMEGKAKVGFLCKLLSQGKRSDNFTIKFSKDSPMAKKVDVYNIYSKRTVLIWSLILNPNFASI